MPRRSAGFIGRRHQLTMLLAAPDRARAALAVAGDAGIGKTRLVEEFAAGEALHEPEDRVR
ncbi:MAG TPA: AAA family ATPase [Actinoplanes sp.]|nr:AAA family ATPase [Actinoplanes sp.]